MIVFVRIVSVLLPSFWLAATVFGQVQAPNPDNRAADPGRTWQYSLSLAGYYVPSDQSYASPTFTADSERIHLECRYNYEALKTASIWLGYNLSFGKNVTLDLTPMVGGVFGRTTGVAPGYDMTLSYKGLELFGQGEYVIDTNEVSNRYFYAWNELSYAPVKWFRFGGVAQRTRVYHTGLDVQRGFLVGLMVKKVDFTTYVFNPGVTDTTLVFSIGYTF